MMLKSLGFPPTSLQKGPELYSLDIVFIVAWDSFPFKKGYQFLSKLPKIILKFLAYFFANLS